MISARIRRLKCRIVYILWVFSHQRVSNWSLTLHFSLTHVVVTNLWFLTQS